LPRQKAIVLYHEENINKRPYNTREVPAGCKQPERKETGTRRSSHVCPFKSSCVAAKYWFGVTAPISIKAQLWQELKRKKDTLED
jgi:hypothetical protein